MRRSLACILPLRQLSMMPMKSVYGWWYQTSIETQFRNLAQQSADMRPWAAAVKAARKPDEVHVGPGEDLLVQFFKGSCQDPSDWWSAPAELVTSGIAEDLQARHGGLALAPILVQKRMLPVEVGGELCRIIHSSVRQQPVQQMSGTVFFRVIAANPDRRKGVNAPHIKISKARMNIVSCKPHHLDPVQGVVLDISTESHHTLDMEAVDLLAMIKAMVRWTGLRDPHSQVSVHSAAMTELAALDDLSAPALVRWDPAHNRVPEVLKRAATSAASAIMKTLDEKNAYVHTSTFVPLSEIESWTSDVLDILQSHHVVQARESEFGEVEIALCASAVKHLKQVVMTDGLFILAVPLQVAFT